MQKKILSNILLLLAVNLLIKPFWILGIDRAVQNTVGNEAYGVYINIFTFSLLFSMLLDFGINNYTSTVIAKHRQLLDKKFSALFPLKIIFSVAYLVVTMTAGIVYGYEGKDLLMLLQLSFNQVMAFFILFFRANINGLQLFTKDAFLSVTDRTMMIAFAGVLLLVNPFFTIGNFVYAQMAGYGASLIICALALRPYFTSVKFSISKLLMWSIVKQAWPFALLALTMTLYGRGDYLLMKKLREDGDMQNGLYAVANRLIEAANMLAVMISSMLLPLFARMIKQKEDLVPVVRLAVALIMVPAFTLATFASVYGGELMGLLSKTDPVGAAHVFKVQIFGFASLSVMYVFGTLLTSNASMKVLNYTALAALVLNLVLNLFLIPLYGARGAAIVSVASHSLVGLVNMYYAVKYLKLKAMLPVLFAVFCGGAAMFGFAWMMFNLGIPYYIAAPAMLIPFVLVLVVSGLFKPAQMISLLSSVKK